MQAGLAGAVLALIVASTAAPAPLPAGGLLRETIKGLWIAWLAATVIFGGLFFQRMLDMLRSAGPPPQPADGVEQHRRLFAACFLIGPFAESATGFGVGYVIALALLMRQNTIAPVPLLVFGLFSQMLVPWGALAVGTMVGAHLADLPPGVLGLRSALLTLPLLVIWLILFWRFAMGAKIQSTWRQMADDVAWVIAAGALLVATNLLLDPEVAAVAALGPLIVARFWRDARPDREDWRRASRTAAPYAALAAILIAVRAVPALHAALADHFVIRPPIEATGWPVLVHPFLWLITVPAAAAVIAGRRQAIPATLAGTWRRGRIAVLATVLFLVMAQILVASGIAQGLAREFLALLGPAAAIVASPVFAALGGVLTGSTTGSNSLFMPTQVALAAAGAADVGWLAAIQNTTASALTMLSPVRVAMGCAMLSRPDLERPTYAAAWPLGAWPLLLMMMAAAILVGAAR